MARTVEEVLARRTRALLLDGSASMEWAPPVGKSMGRELGWDEQEIDREIQSYRELARGYLFQQWAEA